MKWGISVFSLMFEYIMDIFIGRIKRKSAPPLSKNKERKSIQILKRKYKATRFPITPKTKAKTIIKNVLLTKVKHTNTQKKGSESTGASLCPISISLITINEEHRYLHLADNPEKRYLEQTILVF